MRFLLVPGNSPDLNLIKHCFGLVKKKLERQPTRDLAQLKKQLRWLWNNLNDGNLFTLCTSMN